MRGIKRKMDVENISLGVSDRLKDRNVVEVDYDPFKQEYLKETGKFEADKGEVEYKVEINELDPGYRNEQLLDKAIEHVMENPGANWNPDYAEVKATSEYLDSKNEIEGEGDDSVELILN